MKYILVAAMAMILVGCNEMKTSDIVSNVKDGVVLITNEMENGKGGIGSGFIVDENKIITNRHVIDGDGKITVYSDDSARKYDAKVLFSDEILDLAIVQLNDWKTFEEKETPVILSLGDDRELNLGDKIIVMGHPWGLSWSVSEGIISGKDRRHGSNPRYLNQVDAHLYNGNSGGPIFNEKGEVVCVSNLMMVREGGSYGLCIPATLVKKAIHDQDKLGEVRWRAINVTVGLTEDGSSVILSKVEPNGAADKAGLKENDKVLEIYTPGNHPKGVAVTSVNDLITEMAQLKGDDELVKLLIDRNGEKMMIDVKTNFRKSSEYTPDEAR